MKPKKHSAAHQLTPSERLDAIGIERICENIAGGMSLREWCRNNKFALTTVHVWLDSDKDRAEQYARAREERAELIFDELDGHCDEAVMAESAVKVAGLRLKVDTLKWKLGKMNPKKYGDKIAVGGADDMPAIKVERIERVIIDAK